MFGYLTASPLLLSEEELSRYKSAYCGLCRSLGDRHGQFSRLTLNYDMTFLVLLLNSMYEPEERGGVSCCVVHPFESREWWRSEATEYAADMNVALSYLNCLDDWNDDGSIRGLAASEALKKRYEVVKSAFPRQCGAMEKEIAALTELEKSGAGDPDASSLIFGRILGEIFVYKDDRWSDLMYNTGCGLGRFIYLLDAVVDLESDVRKGSYNPLRQFYGRPDNEQRFRDFLKIFLGDAVSAFNALPLVKDAGLLRNILCCGLWSSFENKYHPLSKDEIKAVRTAMKNKM